MNIGFDRPAPARTIALTVYGQLVVKWRVGLQRSVPPGESPTLIRAVGVSSIAIGPMVAARG